MGKTRVQPRFRPRLGRRSRPGVCRWCRCTYIEPCPQGCGWADAEQTLCTCCTRVDRAWRFLAAARLPNMRRAFFRGFMVGTDDERQEGLATSDRRAAALKACNPYTGRDSARYWLLGLEVGLGATS